MKNILICCKRKCAVSVITLQPHTHSLKRFTLSQTVQISLCKTRFCALSTRSQLTSNCILVKQTCFLIKFSFFCLFFQFQTNTYQVILVKSGLKGYVIFTYQCGDIQWSNLNGRGASAVVGYNAGEEVFFNYEASGFPFVGDIISCSSIFENRLTKRQTNTGSSSIYNMSASCGNVLTGAATSCSCWIESDENAFHGKKHPVAIAEDFSPCPSTRMQASEDARFTFQGDFPLETECYVRQHDHNFREDLTGKTFQVYQQCCYNRNRYVLII